MADPIRNQENILKKLNIEQLNPMQEAARQAIHTGREVVLLSPTGTGKTLAFLLPVVAELDPTCAGVQVLILVPSRELAIQIEQVTREMGAGYKANALYGGRAFTKDLNDLKHPPAVLVGTPGRIADHLRRETFSTEHIKTLVLDEFDKSLEVGFEAEMAEIVAALPALKKKVLTSATQGVPIPKFVELRNPTRLDFLNDGTPLLAVKRIISPSENKLDTLVAALSHLGNEPGIVFCNFKDTIQDVSDYLTKRGISHGCFYGDMEQQERERALIKFRNGTHRLLIATDLAARGLDIPELTFIIHFQLPVKKHEFTHRNGRTGRMNSTGTAYVLQWQDESLPDFIKAPEIEELQPATPPADPIWETIFVSGGRKDKISKGDLAGLFFKQGALGRDELGIIELKQDCAFVAVHRAKAAAVVQLLNNTHLKKRKVRVSVV